VRKPFFNARTAKGGFSAIESAMSSAVAIKLSCGTTRDTKRTRSASSASMMRPGEEQLGGNLATHELRQSSQTGHVGAQPATHEKFAESRAIGRDSNVGHQRQLHSPTHGGSVDRRNHGNFGVQQHSRGRRQAGRNRGCGRTRRTLTRFHHHLLHVIAGTERSIGPRDHDAAGRARRHRIGQLGVRHVRKSVLGFGSVQRDDVDVSAPLPQDFSVFVRHVDPRRRSYESLGCPLVVRSAFDHPTTVWSVGLSEGR